MNKLIDDPRTTLYALGQMSPDEEKEYLMEMNNDQEVLKEIESIKQTAQVLRDGLDTSATMRLSPEQIEKLDQLEKKKKNFKFLVPFLTSLSLATLVLYVNKDDISKKIDKITIVVFEHAEGDIVFDDASYINDLNEAGSARSKETVSLGKAKAERSSNIAMSKKVSPSAPSANFAGGARMQMEADMSVQAPEEFNTEAYDHVAIGDYLRVADHPLSTFSTDVDTASYANARRFLNQGQLPPKESVRVEEFINYFDYDYPAPKKGDEHPIRVFTELATSPFNRKFQLVKVGLKAREFLAESRPKSNLVFLIDVSGSMSDPNKLPLVKEAMKMMVRKMDKKETVSIVVYAGASGLVLPATPASEVTDIFESLNKLNAGGSTNGGAGIELAYKVAKENFIKEGNNRVIIVTDGDFNVGTTSQGSLVDMIKEKAKDNIYLTVLGVGMGNFKDSTLEKLAQYGNGNYAYIDSLSEAKKVLIEDRFKTLHAMAKDVKLQVEFNPNTVEAYRLIGYENRKMANQDFNDDKKDAGDMGAGHTVTAFYEIVPKGVAIDIPGVDKLKYQKVEESAKAAGNSDELLTVKIRYKEPDGDKSKLLSEVVKKGDRSFESASTDFKFASAVAGFAMVLREDEKVIDINMSQLIDLAKENKGSDPNGHREELIENMSIAQKIARKSR